MTTREYRITIYINEETKKELDNLSNKSGISKSNICFTALAMYLFMGKNKK